MQGLLSLNKLPVNVAVLDPGGTIVGVNQSWREFGQANGLRLPDAGVGTNYFDVCSDERVLALRRDLTAMLKGELDLFTSAYDCHSATETRWYVVLGLPLSRQSLAGGALLHVNVSELVPLVFSAPEFRAATTHMPPLQAGITLDMIEEVVKRSVGEAMALSSNGPAGKSEAEKFKLLSARLSKRQVEILALLGKGQQNADIAAHLNLSQNTVKLHVSDILRRLDLKSRTQAALLAAKLEPELTALLARPRP